MSPRRSGLGRQQFPSLGSAGRSYSFPGPAPTRAQPAGRNSSAALCADSSASSANTGRKCLCTLDSCYVVTFASSAFPAPSRAPWPLQAPDVSALRSCGALAQRMRRRCESMNGSTCGAGSATATEATLKTAVCLGHVSCRRTCFWQWSAAKHFGSGVWKGLLSAHRCSATWQAKRH